jgi:GGDEF domain-containing protein
VPLRASIGVTLSRPGITSEALVAEADIAMYQSKRNGHGTPVEFSHILQSLFHVECSRSCSV